MIFNQKTWKDRDVQYPGKRTLTNVLDNSDFQDVIVERAETEITEPGDLYRAGTTDANDLGSMNNLEQRIADAFEAAFNAINTEVGNIYPVGAIYQSFSSTPPEELFPNTQWRQLPSGRVLLPVPTNQQSGQSVGANTKSYTPSGSISLGGSVGGHVLTVGEMPRHSHAYTRWEPTGSVIFGHKRGKKGGDFKREQIYSDTRGGNWAHDHPFSGAAGYFSGKAFTIDVRQPYITVYAWERIA